MIATGELKPHLCFSCMDCNDKCKCGTGADWVMDSGISKHFTNDLNDFSSFKEILNAKNTQVQTASNDLQIVGKGTVFIRHIVNVLNTLISSFLRPKHLSPIAVDGCVS